MNQNKAIIYCRVSSAKQVAEGDGLRSQEFRCQQFANQKGLVVERVFNEKGVTGRGDFHARPAMLELLQFLDDHAETRYHVIFDDLKRFARDTLFHFMLRQELSKRGAILLCPNFKFEDTPEGTFVETMYAAFGQLESQQNRRQAMQRMKARLERGYWVFRSVAPGYTYKTDPIHNRLLVPVQPEARIIKEALEGFAIGRFPTQQDLLHYFRKNPIHTKGRTILVDYKMVHRILTNILYTGYIEYPSWGIPRTKGHHKALISLETFERIQTKLSQKPAAGVPKEGTEFELAQMVLCEHCRRPLTSSTVKGRSRYYPYYACYNKECKAPIKNHPKDQVEAAFKEALVKTKPPKCVLDAIAIVMQVRFQARAALYIESKGRVKEQLEAKKAEIASVMESAYKTTSTTAREYYEKRADELTWELGKLEAMCTPKKPPEKQAMLAFGKRVIRTVCDRWQTADRPTKIALHRIVFPTPPAYSPKTGFRTAQKSLAFTLRELFPDVEFSMADKGSELSNRLMAEFMHWHEMNRPA